MLKRPAVESIPLCCNASVKGGEHFIKNYSMDETWEDVLKDLGGRKVHNYLIIKK
jgi:hypothetical protein